MLPESGRHSLEGYKKHGWRPGSFLQAVLENDLVHAAANADEINKYHLFDYANYLYNELPTCAWGSPEKIEAWIKHGGMEGVAVDNVVQLRD